MRGTGELTDTDRGWLGQIEDATTGLSYLNARYYDPSIGRFLSPDPLLNASDPRRLDAYMYANNNPTVYSDASGLEPRAWDDGRIVGAPGTGGISAEDARAASRKAAERAESWDKLVESYGINAPKTAPLNAAPRMCEVTAPPSHFTQGTPASPSPPGPALDDPMTKLFDRATTWVQYEAMANWRRVQNLPQSGWDAVTATILLEEGVAAYQIWLNDAELLNEGDYCGTEAECLTGGRTPWGSTSAITLGHTVTAGVDMDAFDAGVIEHEMQHVYDIENLGALSFYAAYGVEYVTLRHLGLQGQDAYETINFESRAYAVGNNAALTPRGGWQSGW